jgi:CMP-N-acetylneuraminic acid synthetase
MSMKNVLGVITARKGSKGLKKKNILSLFEKPVIYYTIEKALKSKLINKLVVSTEDEKIAKIVGRYGVEVIKRPKNLAKDSSPIEDVLRHTVEFLETQNYIADLVVLLYANVPVRSNSIIDRAIRKIIETDADAVMSITDVRKFHPYWFLKINKQNKIQPFISGNIYKKGYRRQTLPRLFIHDSAVLVVKRNILMKNKLKTKLYSCFGNDIRGIYQRPEETVEIDDLFDLKLAEAILRYNKIKNKKWKQSR